MNARYKKQARWFTSVGMLQAIIANSAKGAVTRPDYYQAKMLLATLHDTIECSARFTGANLLVSNKSHQYTPHQPHFALSYALAVNPQH
jgi:hypothetical protein